MQLTGYPKIKFSEWLHCLIGCAFAEALFTPYNTPRLIQLDAGEGHNENYDYDLLQVSIGDKRAHR